MQKNLKKKEMNSLDDFDLGGASGGAKKSGLAIGGDIVGEFEALEEQVSNITKKTKVIETVTTATISIT